MSLTPPMGGPARMPDAPLAVDALGYGVSKDADLSLFLEDLQ
jgi:hypothetical protein